MIEPSGWLQVEPIVTFAKETARDYLDRIGRPEEGANDLLRGVRVSLQNVARALGQAHPEVFAARQGVVDRNERLHGWLTSPPETFPKLAELAMLFDLTQDDVELLLLTAAPAIDPGVLQVYRFCWDDAQKQAADVGFLCRLASLGDPDRFEQLVGRFELSAPLRHFRLVVLDERVTMEESLEQNLVFRRVRVADRVVSYLREPLDEEFVPEVDENLMAFCMRESERVSIEEVGLSPSSFDSVVQLARGRAFPAILEGPRGAGKRRTAQALADMLGRHLLCAQLSVLLQQPIELQEVRFLELLREARLGGDLILLLGHDLPEMISDMQRLFLERILPGEMLLLGVDSLPPWLVSLSAGWPLVSIPLPSAARRKEIWLNALGSNRPDDATIDAIAHRYEMAPEQIHRAAAEAQRLARIARRKRVELVNLDRACRAYFAHQMGIFAERLPVTTFRPEDLILPSKEREKFDEILLYAKENQTIFLDWGFDRQFPYGRGLSVLFYGPPGTGKTMAAIIIANELGLDLFRVDASRIMSRYVGETEKNLARVFDEAERGRCMLLFDEADALFTRRTDVKTSVDRYANLEVAYLLQRMENFEGVTVLTTNIEQHLDEAFRRRIRYRIYFPLPDAETRTKLWSALLPAAAPTSENLPFDLLGRHFQLAGGHIKNAVLRSALYARRDGTPITLRHLVEGAMIEAREIGQLVSDQMPPELQQAVEVEEETSL
ncbi:MAG: ATP-binding protein [Bradymonadales bacterium]|nr:ATP-binding protein [Bradymonadales bacterium]